MALSEAQKETLERGRKKRAENIAKRKAGEYTGPELVDELPDDKPPATGGRKPKADTPPKPPGRQPGYSPKGASLTKIRTGLVMTFTAAGMAVSMVDTYDGQVIAVNAERLADAWCQVAEQNARVRKVLEAMLEGSALGSAVMTSCMVAIPIMVHHGAASETLLEMSKTMGVEVPPTVAPPDPRRSAAPPPGRGPAAHGGPRPGTPEANGQRDAETVDVNYEDGVTFPHTGPPDRAA
jgi:hypothetical protein